MKYKEIKLAGKDNNNNTSTIKDLIMRPRKSQRDLSSDISNPTGALQKAYSHLMSIKDPQELYDAALEVVRPLVGHGVSEKNFKQFEQTLYKTASKGINAVQQYITMYVLKGSGLGVLESTQESLASMLSEDVDDTFKLTPHQMELKNMVESYGYSVGFTK